MQSTGVNCRSMMKELGYICYRWQVLPITGRQMSLGDGERAVAKFSRVWNFQIEVPLFFVICLKHSAG